MEYRYKLKKENGDATCNYDIIANYPIPFEEFYKNIIKYTNAFRVEFCAVNETYGGWWQNEVELNKRNDGKWYYAEKEDELWQKYKKETVVNCWCNGGWGQNTYYLTFAEPTEDKND